MFFCGIDWVTATRSDSDPANDMAVVLAEGVGGSVEGFADMMNSAAQKLGMKESHFVNPHGLPDRAPRQYPPP